MEPSTSRNADWRWALKLLLVCLIASQVLEAKGQTLQPWMEGYVKLAIFPAVSNGPPNVDLTNVYSAPLVVVTWDYRCAQGIIRGRTGKMDAALTHAAPYLPGSAVGIPGVAPGCDGEITSLIFGDGKELGDPDVLRSVHKCREAAKEELDRTLQEDILTVSESQWDPALSVTKLKTRHDAFHFPVEDGDRPTVELQTCRASAIDHLTASIEDYRSSDTPDPAKSAAWRDLYIRFVREWSESLAAPNYPTRPIWWKRR